MCYKPTNILITGASSGIGRALAIKYADEKRTLFLCGRNKERLEQVANLCRQKKSIVYTFLFDVRDEKATTEAVLSADQIAPIELLVANAGVSAGVLGMDETPVSSRAIFETNIFGVINTVLPVAEKMKSRKKGQIAIISSLSGYRGMASCPAYSASKACVKAWGEALWGTLKSYGIYVTTVCPGFIETPLTDKNHFKMPFLMKVEKAADIIVRRLEKHPPLMAFPWIMAFGAWVGGILPARLILPILGRLPKKEK